MDADAVKREVPRRLPALLVAGAVVLVPWTLVLAIRLPANHTTHHWDLAWVGFDVGLAAALAATGITIARRSPWAPAAATAAATLLLCDAWFDNLLAANADEHVEAALEAALVELPLALLCVWLARNAEQAIESVLAAARWSRGPDVGRRHPAPGDAVHGSARADSDAAPKGAARAARADGDGARAGRREARAPRTRRG